MNDVIARAIAHASTQMHQAATVEETLEVIVRSAVEAIPSFEHVGVSTVEKGADPVNRAATSDLVLELDHLQYGIPEGPCVDSLRGRDVVAAPQIAHDQRWPTYVPGAVERGLRSQLAVPLHVEGPGIIGGLNLYSTTSDDIDPDAIAAAEYFATHASIALGTALTKAQMSEALETRQRIGQAIGVLMERYKIDTEAARAFLRRASSHANVKVRDIADRLVDEAHTSPDRQD